MDHPAAMRAPGAERRTEAMTEPTFTITASHLARTMEAARLRERQKIAKYLSDRADAVRGDRRDEIHPTVVGEMFDEAAEYVRSMGPAQTKTEVMANALADPVEKLWKDEQDKPVVRADERRVEITDDNSGLPPVQHMDDFAEGTAIVRNLGSRGRIGAFGRD